MLDVHLIRPTRYDLDGYPLQWWRSLVPSNSLACLTGIVEDAATRNVLGEGVGITVHARDEIHADIRLEDIIAAARRGDRTVFVGLVGVQTNQYPRALDIARILRREGIAVCIGGFHVSGCLAMLPGLTPELQEAIDLGVSLFAGEAEDGRIDDVLRDAYAGTLKPLYNYLKHTPNLAGAPVPVTAEADIERSVGRFSSFDLGRGCPFECSFCTIINVQGRKSRFRTPDDLEQIIRNNAARNVTRFFLTDDNFARNKNWEPLIDRVLKLREEGLRISFTIQVDTLAHHIPNFIEKVCRAGANQIFIGLENINSDSLEYSKKRQNRIEEYQEMFMAWRQSGALITCGYIIGFPNDTYDSIMADIEKIKETMPIDILYVNFLTPLPGCEDHRKAIDRGDWIDGDLNKFTLSHRVTHHNRMTDEDWEAAYRDAYASFYSWEHMERILKRRHVLGAPAPLTTMHRLICHRETQRLEDVSAMEGGIFRIRRRRQRRHGMAIEPAILFYPKIGWKSVHAVAGILATYVRLRLMRKRIRANPARGAYRDASLQIAGTAGADFGILQTRLTEHAERRIKRANA
ncbi:radical SAM protein (plasmid) [Phyllobacterium sp. 628]|uniref:B12-binding domain-containing radical SAM protein n=1 Tax=Phyllobacterium sp. 628 TaxID=2718938 RepID=UPI0016622555|nr:B12-binding domain-containing radical SAM protein [Phyllobacterium sp. 628]QND54393.1 radical SAM protein [Phyllobacterium sp. 628]